MSKSQSVTGKCLCGRVSVKATLVSHQFGACHCETCRRWHGGPQLAINGGSDVHFTNEADIRVFDSSPWAERGFCGHCGSHLFYRLKAVNRYILMLGMLDPIEGLEFDHQFFIDQKPEYYSLTGETINLTKAEFMARFGLVSG